MRIINKVLEVMKNLEKHYFLIILIFLNRNLKHLTNNFLLFKNLKVEYLKMLIYN